MKKIEKKSPDGGADRANEVVPFAQFPALGQSVQRMPFNVCH